MSWVEVFVDYNVNTVKSFMKKDWVFLNWDLWITRIEDHDDIAPIFNEMTDTLRTTYGEYFLAELIEAQDETNHAAVCEVGIFAFQVDFLIFFVMLINNIWSEIKLSVLLISFCIVDMVTLHNKCKPLKWAIEKVLQWIEWRILDHTV